MRAKLFLILLLSLFHVINLRYEKDDYNGYITFDLSGDMNRNKYYLKLNENYRFINSDPNYIYFLEYKENIIFNSLYHNSKHFVCLPKNNDNILIEKKYDSEEQIIIYVTSISNEKLNINIIHDLYYSSKKLLNKNLINIVYVNEFEDQIINLVSIEKSILFSFWKYEFNGNSPKDYYPIKRTLFKRYNENEDILTLEKNSIYIIIAEKYKFGSDNLNTIEIFVSQAQIYKNVFLYTDDDDYLYLKASEESYVINFSYFSYYNRVLKLSKKSYNSIVTLNGDIILDSKNHYYELNEEQMNGGIEIEVSNNDCLIELLFSSKNNFDFDVLDFYSIERYKLNKKCTIIKIPKNKCTYEFKFTNENKYNLPSFDFSYTTKISKSSFFSNCLGLRIKKPSNKNEITLNISTPYLYNTKVDDDEFQI